MLFDKRDHLEPTFRNASEGSRGYAIAILHHFPAASKDVQATPV